MGKGLVEKPDNLKSMPMIYTMEGESKNLQLSSGLRMHPYPHRVDFQVKLLSAEGELLALSEEDTPTE